MLQERFDSQNRSGETVMKIDNAVIQIFSRAGCAPDEPGFFEDFKVLPRPTSKDAALKELRLAKARWMSDCFRLKLEDWNTCETEIIE